MFYLSTQILRRQYCCLKIGNQFVPGNVGLVKEMFKILYMVCGNLSYTDEGTFLTVFFQILIGYALGQMPLLT